MDRLRTQSPPIWHRRPTLWLALTLAALALATFATRSGTPAGYPVARASIAIGTVAAGALDVRVHGNGVLVPETSVLIATQVAGRVERIRVRAGRAVQAGEVLVELSNPAQRQLAEEDRWSLQAQEAELNALRVGLASEQLALQTEVVKAEFAHDSAKLQLDAEARLIEDKGQIIRAIDFQRSRLNVQQLADSLRIERARLQQFEQNREAQILAKRAQVEQWRQRLLRSRQLAEALTLRAPIAGIVQGVEVELGQQLQVGGAVAKVADPSRLYAELKVPEQQARDLALGQDAQINTRNGMVKGRVVRIDPAVVAGMVKVDVNPTAPLPNGARPDLSIEGNINVAAVAKTLYVPRPAQSQSGQRSNVYRLIDDDRAERVAVEFGLASVNLIEVKSGLHPGERIVLNDTALWGNPDRIELR